METHLRMLDLPCFTMAPRRMLILLTNECGPASTLLTDSVSMYRTRQSPVDHTNLISKEHCHDFLSTYKGRESIYYNCTKMSPDTKEPDILASEVRSVQVKEEPSLRVQCTNDGKKPSTSVCLPAESNNGHLNRPPMSEFSETSGFDADWLRVKRLPPTMLTFHVCRFTLQIHQPHWQTGNQIVGKTDMATMIFTDNF